jgi:alkyldihydroxyacetonephosphate synthase
LQERPKFRLGGAVQFADFFTAARALRAISQAGLYPANCRILDPQEAFNTGAADGNVAIMVLAFESGDHPVEPWMKRAQECCVDHGAKPERTSTADAHREGAAGAWRNVFIRMPYARKCTIQRGIISDTFETAITWERFESFHDSVKSATERAIVEATGCTGQVTCRCTHVYPDGPAPYFTFHAAGRHGRSRGLPQMAAGSASALSTFGACSGFTRVTARRIAQPPNATSVTRLQPSRSPGQAARQLPD